MQNNLTTDWKTLERKLVTYSWLQKTLHETNVRFDKDFQKAFKGFYRMRRGEKFCEYYFDLLEKEKHNTNITFECVFQYLKEKYNRMEPSFASKLVATINPNNPVWDSVVLKRLELDHLYKYHHKDRFEKCPGIYQQLVQKMSDLLASDEGAKMRALFQQQIGDAAITDIKILDIVLWQTREEKA